MNLNDFVVLPNKKAKSVKLNARNLQELHMETVTLAQESKEMEEKLLQLKESMSKEKEERGRSGGFRWKSGQFSAVNNNNLTNKRDKESRLQKLSAGKVKIRVLKEESLTALPQPPPPPATISHLTARKRRQRGTICGQCEVKTAGIKCAECAEHYCIGCFAKFHQKGALKLHRMIPIQTDIQTHVSTRDVVNYQTQVKPFSNPTKPNPSSNSSPSPTPNAIFNQTSTTKSVSLPNPKINVRQEDQSLEKGTEAGPTKPQVHHEHSQVLAVNRGEEQDVEVTEEEGKWEEKVFPTFPMKEDPEEEESARSFHETPSEWRGKRSDGAGNQMRGDGTPARPVSVSAMATQADLPPERGAEGQRRGGGEGRVPVRVEFTENSLTYLDRLLLKKHRRTPIEIYQPAMNQSAFGPALRSPAHICTKEETVSGLTAEEEDMHHYCASLFAIPSRCRPEPQITTPGSNLIIEVLDEPVTDLIRGVDQRTEDNRIPTPPVSQSKAPTEPRTTPELNSSNPQTPLSEHLKDTPRTSKTSIKTPTSKTLREPNCSPGVHKSKSDHGSPQLSSSPSLPHSTPKTSKSSRNFPHSLSTPLSPLTSATSPDEHPSSSCSLRSTFTVSPSSSTESNLLPNVYSLQIGSESLLLPKHPQSSQVSPESILSPKLSLLASADPETPRQSHYSLCDPESPQADNQIQSPLSLVYSRAPQSERFKSTQEQFLQISHSPDLPAASPKPVSSPLQTHSMPHRAQSTYSLLKQPPPETYSDYDTAMIPLCQSSPVFMFSSPSTTDDESTLSHQDLQCNQSDPSPFPFSTQNPLLVIRMDEDVSIDSGDDMSRDSLGLSLHEEDSSDDEAKMHESFSTDPEREKHLQIDEPEPSMVVHNPKAGSGSQHFCDLGLDFSYGHTSQPEYINADPRENCQHSQHESDPTGSLRCRPISSLRSYAEEHLDFRVMKSDPTQPTGIQSNRTAPSKGGDISAYEFATSGSWPSLPGGATPELAQPHRRNPGPTSASLSPALSRSSSPPLPACLSRPLSGSSQAAQEIMEICGVDRTGCEDTDLDTDTNARTLSALERELRRMAMETGAQTLVVTMGNSGPQDQQHFTRGRVSEEQKEEEEAAQRDRQSVLLLP